MPLTHEELEQARVLADPVIWADVYLNFKARDYQKSVLRSKSNRVVLRMGRRTGKTACIVVYSLWYGYTHKYKTIIIVTPFESQIRLIWDEFEKYIEYSPELQASIARKSKNPYEIYFKNGSKIKGFTAGTKAGSGAGSVRGQGGDVIILDEGDYMLEKDIVAITAIALEAPERIRIIFSSTPTGKREFFYKICTDRNSSYKQFHFPSYVNPEWNDQAEYEFKMFHSDIDYQHEVEAEFGEAASGVFNISKIEKAATDFYYAYEDLTYMQQQYVEDNNINVHFYGPYDVNYKPPKALRVMGVDWDIKQSTPHFVIAEWNTQFQKLQTVLHEDIPKTEFLLDTAVKRIIELNDIYDPEYIYLDRGLGEYQIETLHAYGLRHPDSGLADKVKGWYFKQNIELIDPSTKELVKKPAKHFMINQTRLLFEREKLMLSYFDDVLFYQIMNYTVTNVTSTGVPQYSKDDHALDAMMLCILAFVLEFPELAQTIELPHYSRQIKVLHNTSQELIKQVYSSTFDKKQSNRLTARIGNKMMRPIRGQNAQPTRRIKI